MELYMLKNKNLQQNINRVIPLFFEIIIIIKIERILR